MRTRKAVINIVSGLIGMLVTTILGFVSSALFARNLGVEISGLNNVMMNVISFLSVTELGIAGAINYNLYKPAHEKDYATISRIMTFYRKCYLIIGTIILCASLVICLFVHHLLKDSTLALSFIRISFLLCAANTVLSYFLAYNRNLLYVFQENYLSSVVDTVFRLICTGFQIFCLVKLKNYHVFLLGNLAYSLISNVLVTMIIRKRYPQVTTKDKTPDRALQSKVLNDVKSLAIIQIGSAMITYTSSIIISKMIGIRVAGMYAYYATLINVLTSIINIIYSNLGAGIGDLLAEGKKDNALRVFHILTHFCLLLGLIVASGLGNAIKPFIEFWVGAEYLLPYRVVIVIAVNFFIMIQRQTVTYFLRTGGYHARMIVPLVIEAIINLSASIFLGSRLGLQGIFLGVTISSLVGSALNAKVFSDCFGINYWKYAGKQFLFLCFFVAQLFVSQWAVSAVRLQCGLLMQFIVSGIISIVIPVIVSGLDVLCNPTLLSIRQKLFDFGRKLLKK